MVVVGDLDISKLITNGNNMLCLKHKARLVNEARVAVKGGRRNVSE